MVGCINVYNKTLKEEHIHYTCLWFESAITKCVCVTLFGFVFASLLFYKGGFCVLIVFVFNPEVFVFAIVGSDPEGRRLTGGSC